MTLSNPENEYIFMTPESKGDWKQGYSDALNFDACEPSKAQENPDAYRGEYGEGMELNLACNDGMKPNK